MGVIVIAQAPRLVVDDLLKARHLVGDGEQLVDLLLILDHREADLDVLQHEGHLCGDRVRIDRHRHATQRLRGHHRPIENAAGSSRRSPAGRRS